MNSFLQKNEKFDEIVIRFQRFVEEQNEDGVFSFNYGFLKDTEGYKKIIPEGALATLEIQKWNKEWIGSGKILTRVIKAVKYYPAGEKNNLVDWRHGESHLKKFLEDPDKLKKIEVGIYHLYKDEKGVDSKIFDELADPEVLRAFYDLISYLFYLKNPIRFLPNRPSYFERAFSLLGDAFIFKMSGHCSWLNYLEYLNRMSEICEMLNQYFDDEDISMIDAHSFCWVISNYPEVMVNDFDSTDTEDVELILTDPVFHPSDSGNKKPRSFKGKKNLNGSDFKKKKIGEAGEKYVLKSEIRKLLGIGRSDLAENVDHVSNNKGDGAGYDILSFSPDGKEMYIEVKTTPGNYDAKFYISVNELEFSRQYPDNYFLYRLYDFKVKSKKNPYYIRKGDMYQELDLSPIDYEARPKSEKNTQ